MKLLCVAIALIVVVLVCYVRRGTEGFSLPVKPWLDQYGEMSETYPMDSAAVLDPIGRAVHNQHARGLFKLEPTLLTAPPDSKRRVQCEKICQEGGPGVDGYANDDCARCLQWADRHTPGWGLTTKDEGIKTRVLLNNFHVLHGVHGHKKPIPFHGPIHSISGMASPTMSINDGILTETTGFLSG